MSSEQQTFVFALVFIITFSALFATMPTAFYGSGETAIDTPVPINASLLNDFTETESYNKSDFTVVSGPVLHYLYTLGGRDWMQFFDGTATFYLDAKVYVFGLWLGQTESVKCVASDGMTDRGYGLTLTEINADADEGEARYNLLFTGSGLSAGGIIFYWNSTTYASASDAWTAGALWFVHGIGLSTTANTDIIALLLQLLLLQLPEVPSLINVLIAGPLWACIVYLIWFIIKESLPFV